MNSLLFYLQPKSLLNFLEGTWVIYLVGFFFKLEVGCLLLFCFSVVLFCVCFAFPNASFKWLIAGCYSFLKYVCILLKYVKEQLSFQSVLREKKKEGKRLQTIVLQQQTKKWLKINIDTELPCQRPPVAGISSVVS